LPWVSLSFVKLIINISTPTAINLFAGSSFKINMHPTKKMVHLRKNISINAEMSLLKFLQTCKKISKNPKAAKQTVALISEVNK
jgi:hypothetical protein